MKLPKELTTVTPLSKAVALLLFFMLPIFAFIFGMNYQKLVDNKQQVVATPTPTDENIACTMDAKICPDGSAVGRVPPDCDFASCPTDIIKEYICPESNYIDCMPGPITERNECNPEYINWAKENCPGFQGAAY